MANAAGAGLPKPGDIDSLPLLHAAFQEIPRLYAANNARMRRTVTYDGIELHGYCMPPGTEIGTNAYCLHRNPEVAADPFPWKLERRMTTEAADDSSAQRLGAMRRGFWAFGRGREAALETILQCKVGDAGLTCLRWH